MRPPRIFEKALGVRDNPLGGPRAPAEETPKKTPEGGRMMEVNFDNYSALELEFTPSLPPGPQNGLFLSLTQLVAEGGGWSILDAVWGVLGLPEGGED